ncbi:MAG TPA: 16S rRNA (guanine(966)-N(2))-methyltransferase RsmD [Acidimicrobiales bacterium]
MRVVAGEARGRRLVTPEGRDTRPTLDRVREALFNALGSLDAVDGAQVLDLFAGSGALGIEALSRGAAHATFVDTDHAARRAIAQNLAATGLAGRAEVVAADAAQHLTRHAEGSGPAYDLVLLDPPYATADETWRALLEQVAAVAPAGVVVVESDREVAAPEGWHALREKRYGGTLVNVLRTPSLPSELS